MLIEDPSQFEKLETNQWQTNWDAFKVLTSQEYISLPIEISLDNNTNLITQVEIYDPDTEEKIGSLSFAYETFDTIEDFTQIPDEYSEGDQEYFQNMWDLIQTFL